MEEQLVSFETAKLAKDKGFNIPCNKMFSFGRKIFENMKTISFHNGDKNECANTSHDWNNTKSQTETEYYSASTQSLLQRWLREKHLIVVDITLSYHTSGWRYSIYKIHTIQGGLHQSDSKNSAEGINTYEGALELGLQKALNLINYEKEEINKTSN